MSIGCQDPNFCRGGCCRDFFGTTFCDVESSCVAAPTWIIVLVPVALGIAAIVLLIFVLVRLHNRKVIEVYDKVGQAEPPISQIKEMERGNSRRNSGLQGQ
jgi:hypothetical protein